MAGAETALWRWQARMLGRDFRRPRRSRSTAMHVPPGIVAAAGLKPLRGLKGIVLIRSAAARADCEAHASSPECNGAPRMHCTVAVSRGNEDDLRYGSNGTAARTRS